MHAHGSGCRQPHLNEMTDIDSTGDSGIPDRFRNVQQMGVEMASGSSPLATRQILAPSQTIIPTMPYYNVIIPIVDNFTGPVNTSVTPSMDPNGSDLPAHGMLASFSLLYHVCGIHICLLRSTVRLKLIIRKLAPYNCLFWSKTSKSLRYQIVLRCVLLVVLC